MKDELKELLEDKMKAPRLSLSDLANDPFLLRKEKAAIEFLTNNPVPKHLLPKKKKSAL
jgi:hypothetical protein